MIKSSDNSKKSSLKFFSYQFFLKSSKSIFLFYTFGVFDMIRQFASNKIIIPSQKNPVG